MKKIPLAAGAIALVVSLSGAQAGPRMGSAEQFVIHERPEIKAQIAFLDTGSPENGLIITGEASGLDPTETYVTLLQDQGSKTVGEAACESTLGLLDDAQSLVGFWLVDKTGYGKLHAVKSGESYVPLAEIGTVGIRAVRGPAPSGFVLKACSSVELLRRLPRPEGEGRGGLRGSQSTSIGLR